MDFDVVMERLSKVEVPEMKERKKHTPRKKYKKW